MNVRKFVIKLLKSELQLIISWHSITVVNLIFLFTTNALISLETSDLEVPLNFLLTISHTHLLLFHGGVKEKMSDTCGVILITPTILKSFLNALDVDTLSINNVSISSLGDVFQNNLQLYHKLLYPFCFYTFCWECLVSLLYSQIGSLYLSFKY